MGRSESWIVAVMPHNGDREPVGDAATLEAALALAWKEFERRGLLLHGTEVHALTGRIRLHYPGGYVVCAAVPTQ